MKALSPSPLPFPISSSQIPAEITLLPQLQYLNCIWKINCKKLISFIFPIISVITLQLAVIDIANLQAPIRDRKIKYNEIINTRQIQY